MSSLYIIENSFQYSFLVRMLKLFFLYRSHKLVVHTDPICWKYCCEVCNKMFPIKSNYDSHMRRHTGDKKFECHLCQKKFTDKCVLQRHMRTHTNVREHKCTHCDREYKDPGVLKVIILTIIL